MMVISGDKVREDSDVRIVPRNIVKVVIGVGVKEVQRQEKIEEE